MHAEREASVRAQRVTGTALMVVKHQVVEEAFRETDVKLVNMYGLGAKSHPECLSGRVGGRRPGEFEPAGSPVKGRGSSLDRDAGFISGTKFMPGRTG